ncbi:helix-turn-helix domain-containing protein [Kitasatospora acidiphila]|uniref:Helix-turn-helix domain-containing protein n=1 Tax=Kitasatospora acidiphila TaxID=2567942 RepID=A0A540WAR0_9ACTN|nr:helix-turn-helix transcriptional regulator [Kitasatospora acidiphila]TQF06052.1 helix-turn-helix domain-containing protein [Kitasatospora acidiphila]
MPPRSNPTARQQRLGVELRKLREAAGMSTEQAAAVLATNRTVITNTEAGRHGISPERVRRLACNYDCTDSALVEALVRMASDRTVGWWEEYRGILPPTFLDIAELEWFARRLRMSTMTHIPGPFQTEAYARALFAAAIPELPPEEFDTRVAHRVQRRQVLDRVDPPSYVAIIHEAALRIEVGGRKALRDQLWNILELSERDTVTIQVIPFSAGAFPGSGQTILYAAADVPSLDVVQLDRAIVAEFLHVEAQLRKFALQLDQMERVALSPEETRSLIHSIAREL